MKTSEVEAKKAELICFYCLSALSGHKNLLAVSDKNQDVPVLYNWKRLELALIFCSSDCMYAEFAFRWGQRLADGTAKVKPIQRSGDGIPAAWTGEEELVRDNKAGVFTSSL